MMPPVSCANLSIRISGFLMYKLSIIGANKYIIKNNQLYSYVILLTQSSGLADWPVQ